jgi:hypothetical protein
MSNINNYPRDKIPDCWIPEYKKQPTKAKRLISYLIDKCPLEKESKNFLTNVYRRRVKMFELLDQMTDKELEDILK